MRKLLVVVMVSLLSLLGAACTVVVQPPAAPQAEDSAAMDTAQADHGDHGQMMMDADIPFDAQFIDSMIIHHQGAVDMAQAVLDNSQQPDLRALAEAIILAQTGEIEEMQTWREAWFPDLPATAGMDMGMGDMEIADDPAKPFEQRFIEAMISHHQGAIDMAEMALQMSEREEIRTLAEAIIAAQMAEIEMMQGWLEEWYGDDGASSTQPVMTPVA